MKITLFFFFGLLFFSCQQLAKPSTEALSQKYHIVFYSNTGGSGNLYVVDPFGNRKEQITFNDSTTYSPRYNWKTAQLSYGLQEGERTRVIQRAYGEDAEQYCFDNPGFEELPSWNPEATQIVYTHQTEGALDLFLADSNGVNIKQLTKDTFDNKQPVFSPDGRQILFVSNRNGNQDIFLMDLSRTTEVKNLSDHPALEGHPDWSPQGDKILFYRYENGNADLYSLSLEDNSLLNLTNSPVNELIGRFSPDGKYLAYGGIADDNWEIFIANSDGSNKRRLTYDPAFDGDPDWVPGFWDSTRVVDQSPIGVKTDQ